MLDGQCYADAGSLLAEAFRSLPPPDPVNVAEWAAENRWLTNEGGGHVGRWSHDVAPYLVEPMEALTDPRYLTVAVAGPGQSGKTSIGECWMLHSIDLNPGDFLCFMQTDPAMREAVKAKVDPMIEAHPRIAARLGPRPVDRSLKFKRFRGMSVSFLVATKNNLISKSAPRIIADEIDAYDKAFGDPKALLDIRRQSFKRASKLLAISHADLADGLDPRDWNAGIMAIYRDSTRCTWWWPCPECDGWSSPNPGTLRQMLLVYPTGDDVPLDDVADQARLACPCCGSLLEDRHRAAMNRRGRWVGQGEMIAEDGTVTGQRTRSDTAGFWIVGLMSPFLLTGMGGLAAARVKAERTFAATGEDRSLREVMTKQWGWPYQRTRRVGSVDATVLADRAEPGLRLGLVPAGVRFLTCGIDTQGGLASRFEWLVRGWGVGAESWVIAHGRVPASPATSPGEWDALLSELMRHRWPLDDESGRTMRIFALGYDSGGEAGVTTQAFDAWRRSREAGLAKLAGKVDGRDAWTMLPLKGGSIPDAQPLEVRYPDSRVQQDRQHRPRTEPMGLFNPNRFKDDLAGQLQAAMPGPKHVHFPAGLRGNYPAEQRTDAAPHLWFEQLTSERRDRRGAWTKNTEVSRNEVWDLMVMTHIMAHLHGMGRMNWDHPPGWAAPWDVNPFVEAGALASPATAADLAPAPMAAPSAPVRRVIRSNFMRR